MKIFVLYFDVLNTFVTNPLVVMCGTGEGLDSAIINISAPEEAKRIRGWEADFIKQYTSIRNQSIEKGIL